ncbi:DNA-directed RNA polymerase III subunit RPC10-like protein [Drosera capensis]
MDFCPTCGNLLQYELPNMGLPGRYFCRTCPYVFPIPYEMVIKRRAPLAKKKATTSAPGETMDTRPKAEAPCPNPNCGNGLAYFDQKQMRSADEPMSTFYECTECGKTWRED